MSKETMTIRIDPAIREDLDAIASAADRDRTWVVNQALAAYLETYRWQLEHIRQGLREAEAGRFASPAAVKKALGRFRGK
jgi:predicted transcriptional regulator